MRTGPMTLERFRHVNDHLTPLAAVVVVPGLFVAPLSRFHILLGAGLLVYSILMNYLSIFLLRRDVEMVGKFRVISNYVVNIALVLVLYKVWPTVWLLLLLMSVGPALYQDRRDAMLTGVAVAALFLVVHGLWGTHSAGAWAEAVVKAYAIVAFSLFVSGVPTARTA